MKKILFFLILAGIPAFIYPAFMLDNCKTGTPVNAHGGVWSTYNDGFSSVTFTSNSTPGYKDPACRLISATILKAQGYAGAICSVNPGSTPEDLSGYYGVRFFAKGKGEYTLAIPISATQSEYNHFSSPFSVNEQWQLFEIPFSSLTQLWGTAKKWDPSAILGVQFTAAWQPGQQGSLYLDDIEFYKQNERINTPAARADFISFRPKVNQAGFLPDAEKYFTVVSQTAGAGAGFIIRKKAGDAVVFSGKTSGSVIHDGASGETVVKGEFSSLKAAGEYYAEINGRKSFVFKISRDVYDDLFWAYMRRFYLIRSGVEIVDPVSGLSRPASHVSDAVYDDRQGKRDLTGGWYNAGDYGKWTHEHAVTCSLMMWIYELKQNNMKWLKTGIPGNGNKAPDILNEARWGLEWLLKMQNPDGSVYHKVDSEPDFAWGIAPDKDPTARSAKTQARGSTQYSTIDAADLCAVMCQAYRVYSATDAVFAGRCKTAATAAWDWLDSNPKTGEADVYYNDPEYREELLWARAEMYRLTKKELFLKQFESDVETRTLNAVTWSQPDSLGYMAVYFDGKSPQAVKTGIKTKVQALADAYLEKAAAGGYGNALAPDEYLWCSNYCAAARGDIMLLSYMMTREDKYREGALQQLNYLLGNNALEKCFVTGFGSNPVKTPYHWTYRVYGKVLPGLIPGGPNGYSHGADAPLISLINEGTPPAKCYLDLCASNGSYASNECGLDDAAFIFLSGFFYNGKAEINAGR